MTTQVLPTLPDRDALRALYDEAVDQINKSRSSAVDLTSKFYAETGNGVFDAAYLALSDYCNGPGGTSRVHVVSAPAGGGKTSFSYAFMVALTRYAETHPKAPYGCVLVVDQIKKADDAFKQLNALMPGKVAVWTTEHDTACKSRPNGPHPAATFTRDELRLKPIAVVTHAFYNGRRGNKATNVRDSRTGHFPTERALVMVDERPEEVEIYETTLKEAQDIKEKLEAKRPDLSTHLSSLMLFMMPYSLFDISDNTIGRPSDAFGRDLIAEQLEWFTTKEADYVAKGNAKDIVGLDRLFGFAKALTQGYAFTSKTGAEVYYTGWQTKLMVRPGMVLLDATSDIDGVTPICPWRQHAKVPQANYANLEITHVPQHTRVKLKKYFSKVDNRRAYAEYMEEIITEHMRPGERGLVVCKKTLLDNKNVPNWPEDDPRFKDPESFQYRYEWDIGGRKLCVINYGTGIGSNAWQDADAVFLFDEFHPRRSVAAATVQGLRGHRADQGSLASMTTVNSNEHSVDIIAEGHRLRWTKQLALRGRGRCYDEHGNCGKQRLVISSDLKSFMSNVGRLFPGATPKTLAVSTEEDSWSDRVLKFFGDTELPSTVKSTQLSTILKRRWGTISKRVMTPQFMKSLNALGWEYVPGKGRRVSLFKRTLISISSAA